MTPQSAISRFSVYLTEWTDRKRTGRVQFTADLLNGGINSIEITTVLREQASKGSKETVNTSTRKEPAE